MFIGNVDTCKSLQFVPNIYNGSYIFWGTDNIQLTFLDKLGLQYIPLRTLQNSKTNAISLKMSKNVAL